MYVFIRCISFHFEMFYSVSLHYLVGIRNTINLGVMSTVVKKEIQTHCKTIKFLHTRIDNTNPAVGRI